MACDINIGIKASGLSEEPAYLDLLELLSTRLLVQGNSGSGKSHLLRRLLEQSAGEVQQVIIDPEGDFVSLAEHFQHLVIAAEDYSLGQLRAAGERIRQHRISIVLNLENVEVDMQLRSAAALLGGLFDAPREYWFPVLVVVDEAQLFAPAGGGEYSEEARRASLSAMTNLMCRGRKRGLAGVIATQRLAKLAKNVAAEASNFLMGRTFLDIDMMRASDLLGMERRQAEAFRDLERGHFIALGPAIARRPMSVKIGVVETASRSAGPVLQSLKPPPVHHEAEKLILADLSEDEAFLATPSERGSSQQAVKNNLLDALTHHAEHIMMQAEQEQAANTDAESAHAQETQSRYFRIVEDLVKKKQDAQGLPAFYQNVIQNCRIAGLAYKTLTLERVRIMMVLAQAGGAVDMLDHPDWLKAEEMAAGLAEDIRGVFLVLAYAALKGQSVPSYELLARVYGTVSLARARRQLDYLEEKNSIVICAEENGKKRKIVIVGPGWETALTPVEL